MTGIVGNIGIESIENGLLGRPPFGDMGPTDGDIKLVTLGLVETVETPEPIALAGDDSVSVVDESFLAAVAAA